MVSRCCHQYQSSKQTQNMNHSSSLATQNHGLFLTRFLMVAPYENMVRVYALVVLSFSTTRSASPISCGFTSTDEGHFIRRVFRVSFVVQRAPVWSSHPFVGIIECRIPVSPRLFTVVYIVLSIPISLFEVFDFILSSLGDYGRPMSRRPLTTQQFSLFSQCNNFPSLIPSTLSPECGCSSKGVNVK